MDARLVTVRPRRPRPDYGPAWEVPREVCEGRLLSVAEARTALKAHKAQGGKPPMLTRMRNPPEALRPPPPMLPVSRLRHCTEHRGLWGVLEDGGLRGGQLRVLLRGEPRTLPLSCWSPHPEAVRGASELPLLLGLRQTLAQAGVSPEAVSALPEDELRAMLISAPSCNPGSRDGTFELGLSLRELLDAYGAQYCEGREPELRVLGTDLYKLEIAHCLLVHGPKHEGDFGHLPRVPREGVSCAGDEPASTDGAAENHAAEAPVTKGAEEAPGQPDGLPEEAHAAAPLENGETASQGSPAAAVPEEQGSGEGGEASPAPKQDGGGEGAAATPEPEKGAALGPVYWSADGVLCWRPESLCDELSWRLTDDKLLEKDPRVTRTVWNSLVLAFHLPGKNEVLRVERGLLRAGLEACRPLYPYRPPECSAREPTKEKAPQRPAKKEDGNKPAPADGAATNSKGNEVLEKGVTGTVKWFNVQDGYGFIKRSDTGKDVFVHHTAVEKNNPRKAFRSLGAGETVEFDLVQGKKGPQASRVTGPGGVAVQGSKYAPDRKRYRYPANRPAHFRNTYQNSSHMAVVEYAGNRGGMRGGRPFGQNRYRGYWN